LTGRSHQLRVHLQSIGHPICGDPLYAPEPPTAARMLLHATGLALSHPATQRPLAFDSPAPF
jgi:tRNA pseudouridine32 synthase/23S rRNA pseudouridine746 synthase